MIHVNVVCLVPPQQPSVILHSAAERRPDVVEKEEEKTKNLNVNATTLLCELASE